MICRLAGAGDCGGSPKANSIKALPPLATLLSHPVLHTTLPHRGSIVSQYPPCITTVLFVKSHRGYSTTAVSLVRHSIMAAVSSHFFNPLNHRVIEPSLCCIEISLYKSEPSSCQLETASKRRPLACVVSNELHDP